MSSFVGELMG